MVAKLELLTMNLWGLPWPLSKHRRVRKHRFLHHVLQRSYDVIGIQELWWPWHRTFKLDPLHFPRSHRDAGLALSGRLRSREQVAVEHFSDHGGFDRLKRKGFLSARVEPHPGLPVAVHVTHLQAGPHYGHVRARQLDQLLNALEAQDGPTVVMGDFNFYADVEEDRLSCDRLREAGFVDAAAATSSLGPTYTAANPYVRRRRRCERFDRVFLRDGGGLRLQAVETEVLGALPHPVSDHHPVRVIARLSD